MAASAQTKRLIARLAALALIALLGGALSVPRVLRGGADRPVTLVLPDRLGPYRGENIYFCQNEQCLAHYEERVLEGRDTCPRCGSPLDWIAPGERILLPRNTPILRKNYHVAGEPSVNLTIVFSGIERRSIHRPQVCLSAQGFSIRDERTAMVELPERGPLALRVLDVVLPGAGDDGTAGIRSSIYAYWFFNPERETPGHFHRLARMAYDNVFRNYRPRWAYVMVATTRDPRDGPTGEMDRIERFLELVLPVIEEYRRAKRKTDPHPDQA